MDRPTDTSNIIPSIRVSNIIKKAIGISKGNYITCISADDYFIRGDRDNFSVAINYLTTHNNISAYCYAYEMVWENKIRYCFCPASNAVMWNQWYMHLSCFIVKRKVIESNYFLKWFCDDTGFLYSILCNGKVKYDKHVNFAYRQREESITHKADNTKLYLTELLLLQDCLNCDNKHLHNSTLSRFYEPLAFFKNNEFDKLKYLKYIDLSKQQDYQVVALLANGSKDPKFAKLLNESIISKRKFFIPNIVVRVRHKIYEFFWKRRGAQCR